MDNIFNRHRTVMYPGVALVISVNYVLTIELVTISLLIDTHLTFTARFGVNGVTGSVVLSLFMIFCIQNFRLLVPLTNIFAQKA